MLAAPDRGWPFSSVYACDGAAAAITPFDVGCRAQLFIDRVLVQSAQGVTFTLHPAKKHPDNPLKDGPSACVIYDEEEKLFKSWGHAPLLTSIDGMKWHRTDSKPWTQFGYVRVMKDTQDTDPARRYKIIAWGPNAGNAATNTGYNPPIRSGYNTYVSPDGQQIVPLSKKPIWPGGDVITGYYDRQRGLFVAFPKTMVESGGFRRRCFSIMTSKDFETWSAPKLVFVPDRQDDAGSLARLDEVRPILDMPTNLKMVRTEFYGIGGPYQAEGCVVVFPWMITVNNKGRYGNQDGCGEVQIAVSRDLEHWERPFRTSAIGRGKVGQWDCGFCHGVSEALRVGDEVWVYYYAMNYPHAHPVDRENAPQEIRAQKGTKYLRGIGLASWKLDRFVSVDSLAGGGRLTTVPIIFTGNRLELNAATRPGGQIVVELLAAAGNLLVRSKPISDDDLRHHVQWESTVNLATMNGMPVLLRFQLKNAELFSFAFRK
jgi:hypothetical protein